MRGVEHNSRLRANYFRLVLHLDNMTESTVVTNTEVTHCAIAMPKRLRVSENALDGRMQVVDDHDAGSSCYLHNIMESNWKELDVDQQWVHGYL